MHKAFEVWNNGAESLESVEFRIHDGVPLSLLRQRGQAYVRDMFRLFPHVNVAKDAVVVEVGPGVGYIMQAFIELTDVSRVTGLDVAPAMIERARQRLDRDRVPAERFEFVLYDGATFPFADDCIDVFYSVATIQHIPKPYAYNVVLEMQRCLKPGGNALVHLLSWELLSLHDFSFSDEVRRQVDGQVTHWHHFYDRVELEALMKHGVKPSSHSVVEEGASIWVAWTK